MQICTRNKHKNPINSKIMKNSNASQKLSVMKSSVSNLNSNNANFAETVIVVTWRANPETVIVVTW